MTLVSNDPNWWPLINSFRVSSYFLVASAVGVMYDWAMTFGQEVELIWRQHWSLMTVLYLSIRYLGILYVIISILLYVPTVPVTDVVSRVMYVALSWMGVVVNGMLGVIMIFRLYAMYERARQVLICLIVIFLGVNITSGVIGGIVTSHISSEEYILFGTYQCIASFDGNDIRLGTVSWILGTTWEVLVLCFAVWVAVKHFRELRRSSAGGIIGSVFTALMKTHMVYFACFVGVSCFELVYYSPTFSENPYALGTQIYLGVLQIFSIVQLFVLGPRLILGVREYHAKLKVNFDATAGMNSIELVYQQRRHVSTSSSV